MSAVLRLIRVTAHMSATRSFSSTAKPVVRDITPAELHKLLQEQNTKDPFHKSLRLIDTREHDEIERLGRIESALNIPFGLLKNEDPIFLAALNDLDKERKVLLQKQSALMYHWFVGFWLQTVFHCMSGRRSAAAAEHALKLGFKDVYNLVGGFKQWREENLPVLPFNNNHSPWVHTIFEPETETAQYIVTDLGKPEGPSSLLAWLTLIQSALATKEAYVIDPVLDYDPFAALVRPVMAKKIIDFVTKHGLNVTKIIDTHVHAVSLSAWYSL